MLQMSAHDPARLEQLKIAFQVFDSNHDGFITFKELEQALRRLQEFKTPVEIRRMFRDADLNHDKKIDFDEFMTITE